jgi:hypothetical protein
MRTMLAGLTVVCVVTLAVPAFAAEETVKGQIIDQTCYMKDKASNAGKDHKMASDVKDCAVACAKKGAPMALLTSEGKVYQITGDLAANMNEKIVPHVAHTVEITGNVTTKDGKNMIAASTLKMIAR